MANKFVSPAGQKLETFKSTAISAIKQLHPDVYNVHVDGLTPTAQICLKRLMRAAKDLLT